MDKEKTDVKDIEDQDGYYVYLLQCENGSLYCGWTVNLKKRWLKHCSKKGAKYTRANPPICLYYYESLHSASEARKREYAIKQMSHQEKMALKIEDKTEVSLGKAKASNIYEG